MTQRLYAVPVWRETPFFTPRERAALAWTEVITQIGREGVSDEAYAAARAHFEEAELVRLTLGIIAINGWNRLSIAFRSTKLSRPRCRIPKRWCSRPRPKRASPRRRYCPRSRTGWKTGGCCRIWRGLSRAV